MEIGSPLDLTNINLKKKAAMENKIRSTTIIGVIHKGQAAIGGDGQVTLGNTVVKHNAFKIRKIAGGKVLCGFAGASADAFTLVERFEE